jgi:predicted regulator of Ras-like GTPase activity (Roadblock/LC7/MglB family)
MSVDSRTPIRSLRRPKKEKESDHLDYSEPDFSSWAARLADYTPGATKAAPASTALSEPSTEDTIAVAAAAAVALELEPVAPVVVESASLEEVLAKLLSFDGALSVAVVDSESGMVLGKAGTGVEIELAAACASDILRARLASTRMMGNDEKIDDLLISLTSQIQIIHPLPSNPNIFTYLIGDKEKSSLAMARYKATEADQLIKL